MADSGLTGASTPVDKVSDTVSERVAATGVLLVGGRSERFGSPKALARFRGETLAERAWRTLAAVCTEVIAVGKSEDGLELPFPVLDDGAVERAPVHGVLAGLRAAGHEMSIVLPVDCPLVTPALLRELAAPAAVPQTGPLPGSYTKAMIPMLEERVGRGELSLRGVNESVVRLEERLLANVNTRMELMCAAVADWAAERDDVAALVVVGSQARSETPADRWSDLDLILLLDDPGPYAEDSGWIADFGDPVLTFLEATMDGHWERRVLYETGEDVDFVLFPASVAERVETSQNAVALLARGYRVLVDRVGIEARLARAAAGVASPIMPSSRELTELASDFWYHALWTAKKLRRGEVYTALDCLDGYMKARLVSLMALHARSLDPGVDTWHAGRFVERWGDPGALVALEWAYARYSVRDVARALWETIDLFQGLEEETARRLGVEVQLDHADLRRRVSEIAPDPRRGSTLRS